jgi:hypothetical protein
MSRTFGGILKDDAVGGARKKTLQIRTDDTGDAHGV